MKKTVLLKLLLMLTLVTSCKSKKEYVYPLIKGANKPYVIIDKTQSDSLHKYFELTKPQKWTRYFDAHGMIFYSPLGTKVKRRYNVKELSDSVYMKEEARKTFKNNKEEGTTKKGSYWDCYLFAYSLSLDSLKKAGYNNANDIYLERQAKLFKNNFNYKKVKESSKKYREIIYYKYKTENGLLKTSNIDAVIVAKERLFVIGFRTRNEFYDFYIDDALKMMTSLEVK